MSVVCMGWVFANSNVNESGQRLVLLALADAAHDDGTGAFPSVKTLAAMCRMSERNVQYCLRGLELGGHIIRVGVSNYGTYVYDVVMEGGANLAPVQSIAPEAQQATHEGSGASGAGACAPPLQLIAPVMDEKQKEVVDTLSELADFHRTNRPRPELVLKALADYSDLDHVKEVHSFETYWTENPPRRMKNVTTTFRAWLEKSRVYEAERGSKKQTVNKRRQAAESLARGEE